MKHKFQILFVITTILISTKFFSAQFLGDLVSVKIPAIYLLGVIIYSLFFFSQKRTGFVFPVQLMTLAILISILVAYLNWDQPITDTLVRTVPFWLYPFFFYLLSIRFSIPLLEKIIVGFGILYVLLYIFQFMNPTTVYFGFPFDNPLGEYDERRGIIRIIFPGAGIFYLAAFICICKLTSTPNNRLTNLMFTIGGMAIPILQVVRQIIVFNSIIYIFHFGTNLSIIKKIVLSIAFIGLGYYILSLNLPIFQSIAEITKNDKNEGDKNIRVVTGTYYLLNFSDNIITKLLGNGVPHYKSSYGIQTIKSEQRGMWLEDVGLIGLYSQFGILAILAWLIIWYKSFTIPLPKQYYYLKYYLWLLLFTSLTSGSIYNVHYLISTVLVLYIYHRISTKNENKLMKFLLKLKQKNISLKDIEEELDLNKDSHLTIK